MRVSRGVNGERFSSRIGRPTALGGGWEYLQWNYSPLPNGTLPIQGRECIVIAVGPCRQAVPFPKAFQNVPKTWRLPQCPSISPSPPNGLCIRKRPCAQTSLGSPLLQVRPLKFPYSPKILHVLRSVPANLLLDKNCTLYRRRRPPTSFGPIPRARPRSKRCTQCFTG